MFFQALDISVFRTLRQQWAWFLVITLVVVVQLAARYARLRKFHGPFVASFTDWWHSLIILGHEAHIHYAKLNEEYGEVVRIGPNHLLTSSPELWMHINNVRSAYPKSPWFFRVNRFEPGKDNVFCETDMEKHHLRRKQMAAGYSGKDNPSLEADVDIHVKELLNIIQSKYMSTVTLSRPMDLAVKVQYLALDIISHIGLGQPFGCLKADRDLHNYIPSSIKALRMMAIKLGLGLASIMESRVLVSWLGPSEKDETGFGRLQRNARLYVTSRLEASTDTKSDMMASFRRHGLNAEELVTECILQVFAGTDTTSTAIRATMLYLAGNARIYQILRREILQALPQGDEDVIPDSIAKNLPYLQAVIREALRMHPPVVELLTRRVPPGGDTFVLDGKELYFPAGTEISRSGGMHWDSKNFGPDAPVFRPERWLPENTDATELARMIKINDQTFGHGKFRCLGNGIAKMEMNKTIAELVRRFDIALVNPEKPWKSTNHFGLFAQQDMWVIVTEREGQA